MARDLEDTAVAGPAAPSAAGGAPQDGTPGTDASQAPETAPLAEAGAYVSAPAYPQAPVHPGAPPNAGASTNQGAPPYQGTPPYPGLPPYRGGPAYADGPAYPDASSAPYPDQGTSFPGWTGPAGPPTRMTPVASPPTGATAGPPWELPQPAGTGPDDIPDGLPRRVKQASLAPQLRDSPHRASGGGAGEAAGPSPEELRKTMTALQRGWQSGRSQPAGDPAMGHPAMGGPSSGTAGQEPPENTAGDRGPATHEPPGGSDGS
jgi:hypothetical protein